MSFRKFIHDNLIAIVIVPTIIAIHFGVDRIQQHEEFVAPGDKKDLPIVMAYKSLKEKILGSSSIEAESKKDS